MNSLINLLSILTSAVVIAFAFQNCAPTSFADSDSQISKMNELPSDSFSVPLNPEERNQSPVADALPQINDTDEDLIEKCESLKDSRKNITELEADGRLLNLKGTSIVKAESVTEIKNANGNIIIFSDSADAQIDVIDSSEGNIILCGFNVNLVQNHTRGNLVIVGGNVNILRDFNGNLRLIGGHVTGSIFGSKGKMTISNFNYETEI